MLNREAPSATMALVMVSFMLKGAEYDVDAREDDVY